MPSATSDQTRYNSKSFPRTRLAPFNWFSFVRIGPYSLTNNLVVAPMAGVTDRPFRMLCKQLGAGYEYIICCMQAYERRHDLIS